MRPTNLVKIKLQIVKHTIQKQLATCDLTNVFIKVGWSLFKLDWNSSALIMVGDLNWTEELPDRPTVASLLMK